MESISAAHFLVWLSLTVATLKLQMRSKSSRSKLSPYYSNILVANTYLSWPGSNNITSEKVPSESTYEPASQTSGIKRNSAGEPVPVKKLRWGFEIKPDEVRLRCMKLLLDRRQKLPSFVSMHELSNQLMKWDMSVEQAVSDYLTALFSHAKLRLEKRYPQMVSTTQIDVVITVPAIWTDAAKDATMRAAEKAGMGSNLFMVSEPEAAAIYAMKSIDLKQKLFTAGDNFILCDAGGGTIDLVSFEVTSLSPLRLEESAPGTGALCGGVFLNLKFQDLVRRRMGVETFQAFCEKRPKAWAVALKYFEDYVKRNFDPVESEIEYDDNKFNVPLPGAEDNLAAGIEGSFITLTSADVSDIFRPHVDRVIELIERQRNVLAAHNKTAKGVILVGGFGQSGYLYRCLKTRFADEDPPPTYTQSANPIMEEGPRFIIMQPENSWTAVVRGAVLTGLERDLVAIRKARRHYGVVVTQRYDPSKHSRKNRYVCAYTQEIRANNQMMWHVVRGQDMPSDTPILLELGQDFWPNEEVDIDETEIIVSDADEPPNEYEPSGDMRVLCTLKSNLSAIPKKHFKKRVSHGRQYRHLAQDYGMSFDGRLTFDQRVDGKVHASIQAIYT